tara:strand:- start:613 stop:900 length:288 start_codon:yes stop_codon:yes gene_type:complete
MSDLSEKIKNIDEIEMEEALADLLSGASNIPNYVISGSGWGWFLDPESHQFIRCSRGTEIVPVDENPDDSDRILVRSPYRFLLIPKDEVQEIGWN